MVSKVPFTPKPFQQSIFYVVPIVTVWFY